MPAARIELDGTEGMVELVNQGVTMQFDVMALRDALIDAYESGKSPSGDPPPDAELLRRVNELLAASQFPPLPNPRSLQLLWDQLNEIVEGWKKKDGSAA